MKNVKSGTKEPKRILLLGSTGSIGCQTLEAAAGRGWEVLGLSANQKWELVEQQARRWRVHYCAMADPGAAEKLRAALSDTDTEVFGGTEGILRMIRSTDAQVTVLNAIVGEAGLLPTLEAVRTHRRLALANKESLVAGGRLVMQQARKYHTAILPVDSEHCAIWQCLRAGKHKEVKRLILTASGGPFFGKGRKELEHIRPEDALKHPTWQMGSKITIDSATMMNKGFEIIEAAWLFGVPVDRISVLVHRESLVHSMVEFVDHTVMAQMAVPDMKACIAYAVEYPDRVPAVVDELDLVKAGALHFYEPDEQTFPAMGLAREAFRQGGVRTAVLNAANEVAVRAFLEGKIGFLDVTDLARRVVEQFASVPEAKDAAELLARTAEARQATQRMIVEKGN